MFLDSFSCLARSLAIASCRMFNKHPAAASCSPASSEPTISNKSCKSKQDAIGLGNASNSKKGNRNVQLVLQNQFRSCVAPFTTRVVSGPFLDVCFAYCLDVQRNHVLCKYLIQQGKSHDTLKRGSLP